MNCQVERFKLSAHSDQGQLLSVIKQVNPKALALVHGERTPYLLCGKKWVSIINLRCQNLVL